MSGVVGADVGFFDFHEGNENIWVHGLLHTIGLIGMRVVCVGLSDKLPSTNCNHRQTTFREVLRVVKGSSLAQNNNFEG